MEIVFARTVIQYSSIKRTMLNSFSTPYPGGNMKVLIMAGGYATRLWHITKDNPKALVVLFMEITF